MLVDLHVHTLFSINCELQPRELIQRALETGLDGICFTETDTAEGLEAIYQLGEEEDFPVFAGAEITTQRGHLLTFLPRPEQLKELIRQLAPPNDMLETIAAINDYGGVAIVAHPYARSMERPLGDFIFSLNNIHAIEVLNSRLRQQENALALEAAQSMKIPGCGGSDVRDDPREMGQAATLFRTAIQSEQDIVDAIKRGEIWAAKIDQNPPNPRNRRYGSDERGRRPRGGRSERQPRGGRGERRPRY